MASSAILTLLGYVGRDAELRRTPSGTAFMNFTVATNHTKRSRDGDRTERTTWYRVSLVGARAESLAPHVRRGQQVFVTGELWQDEWRDRDGNAKTSLEVEAFDIQFAGANPAGLSVAREMGPPEPPRTDRESPAGVVEASDKGSERQFTDATGPARRARPSRQFEPDMPI